jgi:hypothetical protein
MMTLTKTRTPLATELRALFYPLRSPKCYNLIERLLLIEVVLYR